MSSSKDTRDFTAESGPHFSLAPPAEQVLPWEEVDSGRYMPRRVRGSCVGRALG